jgi:hypothetical protein
MATTMFLFLLASEYFTIEGVAQIQRQEMTCSYSRQP